MGPIFRLATFRSAHPKTKTGVSNWVVQAMRLRKFVIEREAGMSFDWRSSDSPNYLPRGARDCYECMYYHSQLICILFVHCIGGLCPTICGLSCSHSADKSHGINSVMASDCFRHCTTCFVIFDTSFTVRR